MTWSLAISGKLTSYLVEQKVLISSGEPGSWSATDGFSSSEKEVLGVLTGYHGTGYAFGLNHLRKVFAEGMERDRKVHVMIVSDHGFLNGAALTQESALAAGDVLSVGEVTLIVRGPAARSTKPMVSAIRGVESRGRVAAREIGRAHV